MKRYEIVRVETDRLDAWTVIEYVDGVCRGGDHHWLSVDSAEMARQVYIALADGVDDESLYVAHHGAPSDVVRYVWNVLGRRSALPYC
jgi:hypothetical protein